MKKLSLSFGLITLMFSLGCGSSNSTTPTPTGNYSVASLNGQYVYQMSGFDLNSGNPYTRMGVFSANGGGTITTGADSFTEGGSVSPLPLTGSYSVSNDGTGTLSISFSTGAALQWAFTIQSSSKIYIAETSTNATGGLTFTGAGTASIQTSVAQPTGTFVFSSHISAIGSSITPTGAVGALTLSGGAITGAADVDALGTGLTASLPVTGSMVAPDTTGLGTGSLTLNSVTSTFSYYVIDASHLALLFTSLGSEGLGKAELQTGGPFSNASLNTSYAFGLRGDTGTNLSGIHTVGRFTADGNGGITAGALDAQSDGTLTSNATFTGTYTVAANGRAPLSLTIGSGTAQHVYWMVSPSRAFFLVNDPNKVAEGTADLQTASSFSNSTPNGQFAYLNDGVTLSAGTIATLLDRVATLQWNGAGGLTFNEFINVSGSISTPGFLTGTYSAASNGRTTGKINGSTNNVNLVFYFVSPSQAYVLQTDPNTEVDGFTQLQQ
jgi:hypothetical protein